MFFCNHLAKKTLLGYQIGNMRKPPSLVVRYAPATGSRDSDGRGLFGSTSSRLRRPVCGPYQDGLGYRFVIISAKTGRVDVQQAVHHMIFKDFRPGGNKISPATVGKSLRIPAGPAISHPPLVADIARRSRLYQ